MQNVDVDEDKYLKRLQWQIDMYEEGLNNLKQELKYYLETGSKRRIKTINNRYYYGIDMLELSIRARNALCREKVYSLEDLLKVIEEGSILAIRNFGKKSLDEVMQKLNSLGLIV